MLLGERRLEHLSYYFAEMFRELFSNWLRENNAMMTGAAHILRGTRGPIICFSFYPVISISGERSASPPVIESCIRHIRPLRLYHDVAAFKYVVADLIVDTEENLITVHVLDGSGGECYLSFGLRCVAEHPVHAGDHPTQYQYQDRLRANDLFSDAISAAAARAVADGGPPPHREIDLTESQQE